MYQHKKNLRIRNFVITWSMQQITHILFLFQEI